jgi:hypothetical protein
MEGVTLNANPSVNIISLDLNNPGTAGDARITVSTINSGGPTTLEQASNSVPVSPTAFAAFSGSIAHGTCDQTNVVTITSTLGGSAVASPIAFVELPGFPATLGGSYADGAAIPCYSSVATSMVCTLEAGVGSSAPRVRLTNLGASLAGGSAFDVKIFRIASPSLASRTAVYFKISTVTAGNLEVDAYAGASSTVFATGTPVATGLGLTLASYVVQTTNNYDLSNGA